MPRGKPKSAKPPKMGKECGNPKGENTIDRKSVKKTKSESALYTNKGHANKINLKAKLSYPADTKNDIIQTKLKIEPSQMNTWAIKSDAQTNYGKNGEIRERKQAWVLLPKDTESHKSDVRSSGADLQAMRRNNNSLSDGNSDSKLKENRKEPKEYPKVGVEESMTGNKEMVSKKNPGQNLRNDTNCKSMKRPQGNQSVKNSISNETEGKLSVLPRDSEIRQFIHIKGKEIGKKQLKKLPPRELLNWKMRAKLEEEAHDRTMLWQKMKSNESPRAPTFKNSRRASSAVQYPRGTQTGPKGNLVGTSVQGTSVKLCVKRKRTTFSFPPNVRGRDRLTACS